MEVLTTPKTYEEQEEEVLKSAKGSKVFRRLLVDMLKMRRDAVLLILAVVITAIAGAAYPLALGQALAGVSDGNVTALVLFSLLFLVIYLVRFFSNRMRTLTSTKLAQYSVKNIRDQAFKTLQRVPVDFYGKVKTGYLISRISNDAEGLSDFLTFQLPQVVAGISTVILSIAVMIYLDLHLTLYALIIVPVMMFFTLGIQGKVRRNFLRTRRTIAAITGNLAENIGAIRAIKSFNVEDRTFGKFDDLNRENFRANMKASLISSAYGASITIMEAAGIAIVIVAGVMQLLAGAATVIVIVEFILYVQEFFDPILQLSQLYNSYQSAEVGLIRIYGIIDSEKEPDVNSNQVDLKDWNSLVIDDVSFAYGDSYALKDVSLRVNRGDRIAIVGHTGAGKTTLSNLVLRFYSPKSGKIEIDGRDMSDIGMHSWRKLVSPVLQDPFLFRGTVIDNIQFSRPDISGEEIERQADAYGLKGIFESLQDGIQTEVGEMGRNLSEGQRQAISVMRAFIRESPIIILDEPTSQIDPYSEEIIIKALDLYLENKTLILITHRFSMVSLADRIVVIDGGKIVDSGNFQELASREGVFSELYRLQHGNMSRPF